MKGTSGTPRVMSRSLIWVVVPQMYSLCKSTFVHCDLYTFLSAGYTWKVYLKISDDKCCEGLGETGLCIISLYLCLQVSFPLRTGWQPNKDVLCFLSSLMEYHLCLCMWYLGSGGFPNHHLFKNKSGSSKENSVNEIVAGFQFLE